jgi:DNA-binding MarR family transcriptional regulator
MDADELYELWLALRQAEATVESAVDAVLGEESDLSLDWYQALRWLEKEGAGTAAVPQRGLERAVGLTASGASRLLTRVEGAGLIAREPSPDDRRSSLVRLTAAGQEAVRRASPHFADAIKVTLAGNLGDRDRERLLTALRKISASGPPDPSVDRTQDVSVSGVLTWHTVDAIAANDAMTILQALDGLVFSEAARYSSEEGVRDLRTIVIDMVRALDEPDAFLEADARFHRRLAQMCQNRLLRSLYTSLFDRFENGLDSVDADSEVVHRYLQHRLKIHVDLIDAIARGDVESAHRSAMEHKLRHIDTVALLEGASADDGAPPARGARPVRTAAAD